MAPDHNPYMPPAAAVDDVVLPDTRLRPTSVVIAVALIGLYALYTIFGYVRVWFMIRSASDSNLILLGFQVARWLALFIICLYLWRGRNWARMLLMAVTAFSVVIVSFQIWWSLTGAPPGVKYAVDVMAIVMALLAPLIYLLATFLVFFPGRAWFAPRRLAN